MLRQAVPSATPLLTPLKRQSGFQAHGELLGEEEVVASQAEGRGNEDNASNLSEDVIENLNFIPPSLPLGPADAPTSTSTDGLG